MEMRNCPRCRKVFNYMSSPICENCEKEEEKIFENVRSFLKENPHFTLGQVAEATEVSPKKILKYVKEGRLEISNGMHGAIRCEQCNKPISKGKYCDSCVIQISQQVEEMFTVKDKPSARMHISKRQDKR